MKPSARDGVQGNGRESRYDMLSTYIPLHEEPRAVPLPYPIASVLAILDENLGRDDVVGAWVSLRDFYESTLRFLAAIVLAERRVPGACEAPELAKLLRPIFGKAPAMGDWSATLHSAVDGMGSTSILHSLINPPRTRPSSMWPLLREAVEWRNDTIGHGALGVDRESRRAEVEDRRKQIKDRLDELEALLAPFVLVSDRWDEGEACWDGVAIPELGAVQDCPLDVRFRSRDRSGRVVDLLLSPFVIVDAHKPSRKPALFLFDKMNVSKKGRKRSDVFLDFWLGRKHERMPEHPGIGKLLQYIEGAKWVTRANTVSAGAPELWETDAHSWSAHLQDALRKASFGGDIERRFVNPRYLTEKIRHTVDRDGLRYVHIIGSGGMGKTWLAARLSTDEAMQNRARDVLCYHIGVGARQGAPLFRIELEQQALVRFGVNTRLLTLATDDPEDCRSKMVLFLKELIARTGRPVILILDGLDELRPPRSGPTIVDHLPKSSELPSQARIILTSRPEREIHSAVQTALLRLRTGATGEEWEEILLNSQDDCNLDLLREYIRGSQGVSAGLKRLEHQNDLALVEGIIRASGGVFLNVAHLCALVNMGGWQPGDGLPTQLRDLYGRYLEHLRQILGAPLYDGLYSQILACLTVAEEPLTLPMLSDALQVPLERSLFATLDLAEFFRSQRVPTEPWSLLEPTHEALREHIAANGQLALDAHRALGSMCLVQLQDPQRLADDRLSRYAVRYGADHLMAAAMDAELLDAARTHGCALLEATAAHFGRAVAVSLDSRCVESAIALGDRAAARDILAHLRGLDRAPERLESSNDWLAQSDGLPDTQSLLQDIREVGSPDQQILIGWIAALKLFEAGRQSDGIAVLDAVMAAHPGVAGSDAEQGLGTHIFAVAIVGPLPLLDETLRRACPSAAATPPGLFVRRFELTHDLDDLRKAVERLHRGRWQRGSWLGILAAQCQTATELRALFEALPAGQSEDVALELCAGIARTRQHLFQDEILFLVRQWGRKNWPQSPSEADALVCGLLAIRWRHHCSTEEEDRALAHWLCERVAFGDHVSASFLRICLSLHPRTDDATRDATWLANLPIALIGHTEADVQDELRCAATLRLSREARWHSQAMRLLSLAECVAQEIGDASLRQIALAHVQRTRSQDFRLVLGSPSALIQAVAVRFFSPERSVQVVTDGVSGDAPNSVQEAIELLDAQVWPTLYQWLIETTPWPQEEALDRLAAAIVEVWRARGDGLALVLLAFLNSHASSLSPYLRSLHTYCLTDGETLSAVLDDRAVDLPHGLIKSHSEAFTNAVIQAAKLAPEEPVREALLTWLESLVVLDHTIRVATLRSCHTAIALASVRERLQIDAVIDPPMLDRDAEFWDSDRHDYAQGKGRYQLMAELGAACLRCGLSEAAQKHLTRAGQAGLQALAQRGGSGAESNQIWALRMQHIRAHGMKPALLAHFLTMAIEQRRWPELAALLRQGLGQEEEPELFDRGQETIAAPLVAEMVSLLEERIEDSQEDVDWEEVFWEDQDCVNTINRHALALGESVAASLLKIASSAPSQRRGTRIERIFQCQRGSGRELQWLLESKACASMATAFIRTTLGGSAVHPDLSLRSLAAMGGGLPDWLAEGGRQEQRFDDAEWRGIIDGLISVGGPLPGAIVVDLIRGALRWQSLPLYESAIALYQHADWKTAHVDEPWSGPRSRQQAALECLAYGAVGFRMSQEVRRWGTSALALGARINTVELLALTGDVGALLEEIMQAAPAQRAGSALRLIDSLSPQHSNFEREPDGCFSRMATEIVRAIGRKPDHYLGDAIESGAEDELNSHALWLAQAHSGRSRSSVTPAVSGEWCRFVREISARSPCIKLRKEEAELWAWFVGRETAARQMGSLPDPVPEPRTAVWLRHPRRTEDVLDVFQAMQSLCGDGRMAWRHGFEGLLAAGGTVAPASLVDRSWSCRMALCEAAVQVEHPGALSWLEEFVAEDDTPTWTLLRAADVLNAARTPKAREARCTYLRRALCEARPSLEKAESRKKLDEFTRQWIAAVCTDPFAATDLLERAVDLAPDADSVMALVQAVAAPSLTARDPQTALAIAHRIWAAHKVLYAQPLIARLVDLTAAGEVDGALLIVAARGLSIPMAVVDVLALGSVESWRRKQKAVGPDALYPVLNVLADGVRVSLDDLRAVGGAAVVRPSHHDWQGTLLAIMSRRLGQANAVEAPLEEGLMRLAVAAPIASIQENDRDWAEVLGRLAEMNAIELVRTLAGELLTRTPGQQVLTTLIKRDIRSTDAVDRLVSQLRAGERIDVAHTVGQMAAVASLRGRVPDVLEAVLDPEERILAEDSANEAMERPPADRLALFAGVGLRSQAIDGRVRSLVAQALLEIDGLPISQRRIVANAAIRWRAWWEIDAWSRDIRDRHPR